MIKTPIKLSGWLAAAAALLLPPAGAETLVYSEDFENTTNGNVAFWLTAEQLAAAPAGTENIDWRIADGETGLVFPAGSTYPGGTAITAGVSGGDGVDPATGGNGAKGFSFLATPATPRPLLNYTTKQTISRSTQEITRVSWWDGGGGNIGVNSPLPTRFAVRINGAWYATAQAFDDPLKRSPEWVKHEFVWTTEASAWRNLVFTPDQVLALGDALTAPLPEGDITGFGWYVDAEGFTSRLDQLEIYAESNETLAYEQDFSNTTGGNVAFWLTAEQLAAAPAGTENINWRIADGETGLVFPAGSTYPGGTAITAGVSGGDGVDPATGGNGAKGFSFLATPATPRPLLNYTTNATISRTNQEVTRVSWWDGGGGNIGVNSPLPTRFAVQIGGAWYATAQAFDDPLKRSPEWVKHEFQWTTEASAWRNLVFTPDQVLALGDPLTAPLPAGDITGFGWYVDAEGFTSRLDQLEIYTTASAAAQPRLVNISARALAGSGENVLIPGFFLAGTGEKAILARGVGPALAQFQVPNPLADPKIELRPQGSATIVAQNDNWGVGANSDASVIVSTTAAVGAFALPAGSNDASLRTTLAPGGYSLVVSGNGASSGVALAEIYDGDSTSTLRLVNISARGQVNGGAEVMIGGFVVIEPIQVLVRGIGPALAAFQIANPLATPTLEIYRGSETTPIHSNTGWGTASNAAAIATAAAGVGAFELQANSADSALLVTLEPGQYTAMIRGANNATGVALVEIYVVD